MFSSSSSASSRMSSFSSSFSFLFSCVLLDVSSGLFLVILAVVFGSRRSLLGDRGVLAAAGTDGPLLFEYDKILDVPLVFVVSQIVSSSFEMYSATRLSVVLSQY